MALQQHQRQRVLAVAFVCGLALLAGVFLIHSVPDTSSSPVSLFEDITGGQDQLVDPAILRLSNDPWFTNVADAALTQIAEEQARARIEQVIISRVHRMSQQYPSSSFSSSYSSPVPDLDKLTRVAEEQVIYDQWIIKRVKEQVSHRLQPQPHSHELAAVRSLEEKLKAKVMQSLVKEAIREINLLVDATDESPHIKEITKNHLLDRTQAMLAPQVEGRVVRFIQSRIPHAVDAGVGNVLQYLAHSVNEEEKRELLGGPLVDGVDYSFQHQQEEEGPEVAAAATTTTSKTVLAPRTALRKSMLPESGSAAGGSAASAQPAAAAAAAAAASAGGAVGAEGAAASSGEPVTGGEAVLSAQDGAGGVNVGLVMFVIALLAVIGLLAVM